VTTYAYEFNDEKAPDLFAPIALATFRLGAYQGSELQYLFNFNERFAGTNPFTRQQQALSNSMISYWTSFATNADPNSAGQPVWSPYSTGTVQFQSLVPPTPVVESTCDSDHKCSPFWNTF
jgi:para-nitrobenzyl esterase